MVFDSASTLLGVRTAAIAESSSASVRTAVDLILTAPAVFDHVAPDQLRPEVPENERRALGIVMRGIARQKTYVQFVAKAEEVASVHQSMPARILLSMRRAELDLYTTVLAARASGYAAPVVRLPPAVNHMRSQLRDIGACIAGRSPRRLVKLSKLACRVGGLFRSEIDPAHLKLIEDLPSHAAVKLITDAPLELLPVRDLPLGLRFVCSRIPVTPGNLFGSLGLASRPLLLEQAALSRILVVSAFQHGDPLRALLRRAVTESMNLSSSKLNIQWVDVDGLTSFREALNTFDGSILLFDGHGGYSRALGEGSLELGADTVDVWSLMETVRVPPIVILSACETHPMDGTQATVANAFLRLGAQAVLASLVPIDGRHAAILAGRLMLRLAAYLPEVENTPIFPLRWSEIVTGMLRMSYVTDVLDGLRKAGWQRLTEERRREIQRQANDLINYLHPEWFDMTLGLVADVGGTSLDEVRRAHLAAAYFGDSLHYVHLGNPEDIIIMPSLPAKHADQPESQS